MYVGQACNLSERWRNNGKNYFNSIKFYNAIKKYGWDNFTHEVVYSNLNKQAADKLEKELIHKYNSIEEGYNLKEGGSRGELSTKSLAKMSESLKRGYFEFPERREKIRNKALGRKMPKDTGDNVDQKIIESAIIFWFKDVDCKSRNKVVSYFKEY